MPDEIENAVIQDTRLGICDHGMISFTITLAGSNWAQGLGGYGYDYKPADQWVGKPGLPGAIRGILETVEKSSWEDLKGTLVRVRRKKEFHYPEIGHILKDQWFDLDAFMKKVQA